MGSKLGKPSNKAVNDIETRPNDDQQPRLRISGIKHGIAGTSNIKQPVHFREDDDNNEYMYNHLLPQQQRPGLLPPIDNEQSHKSNIDQYVHFENSFLFLFANSCPYVWLNIADFYQSIGINTRIMVCKVASDKLTHNNPNITDLSDENRAFRVGEKLSELYSNEWSDAYEELTEGGRRSDIQAINILLEILKIIFGECKRKAEGEIRDIGTKILELTGHSEILEIFVPKEEETVILRNYVRTTTETCWLMCLHEPPLTFEYCEDNNNFNEVYFNPYTRSGDTVEFLVWPAILLNDGGPLLLKCVAQAKDQKQKEQKVQTKQTNDNANTDSIVNERSFDSYFSNETELSRRAEAAVTRINEDFVSNTNTIERELKARRTKEHSSKPHNEPSQNFFLNIN